LIDNEDPYTTNNKAYITNNANILGGDNSYDTDNKDSVVKNDFTSLHKAKRVPSRDQYQN
jgi:hypothetical protein